MIYASHAPLFAYVKGAVSSMVEVSEGCLDAKQQVYKWKKNNKVIFEDIIAHSHVPIDWWSLLTFY